MADVSEAAVDEIRGMVGDAKRLLDALLADDRAIQRVELVAQAAARSIESGGKVLAIGNGGSAADAMHFCEELTGRFRDDRKALPAIACTDPGHLTCTANDFGYDAVFSRWVQALGREGDVLVALSTSGNSRNILRAVETAEAQGLTIVLLLGKGGGVLKGRGRYEWVVPPLTNSGSRRDAGAERIQEVHMLLLHAVVDRIEAVLGLRAAAHV